ncbi:hypothetical protein FRC10_003770 [Ceratobasidium sp. 414]|nr:hypothetical protein FRC10_003770 [Ceratobasidium sp. 414]
MSRGEDDGEFGALPLCAMATTATMSSVPEQASPTPPAADSSILSPPKKKLKRNRVTLSSVFTFVACVLECHRRKQQCDRGNPCSRCVKRGMGDQCIMESPPTQGRRSSVIDASESQRLAQRIEQLEALVRASYGDTADPTNMSEADMAALLSATRAAQRVSPRSQPPERAVRDAAAALGQLSQGTGDNPLAVLLSQACPSSSQFGAPKSHSPDEPNPADPVASFPASPHVTGQLARYFFEASSIHWYCVAVHKPVFYDAYLEFFSGRQQTVPDLDFCVLLAIMCALTLQFCGDADAQASLLRALRAILAESVLDRDALRQKMFHFARAMLTHSERTQGPTLERISAMILITIYLENEGNMIEYYATIGSAIRTAQSMGMHRDGETKWQMNPVEAEQRRRLWWILYAYDRLQNFVLCRPYVIHNAHCDCRLPLNADQAELIEERELVSHPLNQPTEHSEVLSDLTCTVPKPLLAFQLLQVTWAQVIGEISDHCFSTLTPTYRTILHMEHEIRIFEVSLPAAFRPGSAETGARPYILFQSQILMLQVHHARVLLLRPFVFKRDAPPYEPENQQLQEVFDQYACDKGTGDQHSALSTRLLAFQQIMHSQIPRHQLRWFLCVNSAFDAALTLASALILQPDHPLAEDIDYWLRAGQNLLRSMCSFHHVASESVKALHIVRNRSLTARGLSPVEGDGFNPPPVSINVPPQHYSPQHPHHVFDPLLSAEMDRAHRTLSQSPVLVADSLGPAEMSNGVWDTLIAQVFETGVLPSSVEMLSGEFDAEELFERFL